MKKLFVAGHSEYQSDLNRFNISNDELIRLYELYKTKDVSRVLSNHETHNRNIDLFRASLKNASFCWEKDIEENISSYDLIIVLGGSNLFFKISRMVNQTPILPIENDFDYGKSSVAKWVIECKEDIEEISELLNLYKFDIEEWPRLECIISGKRMPSATGNYFVGERQRNNASILEVNYNNKIFVTKCSGLIVSTGVGGSGWYASAGGVEWEPTHETASFIITEPRDNDNISRGELSEENELNIKSMCYDGVIVSDRDSETENNFYYGSNAKIFIGGKTQVISPIVEVNNGEGNSS